MLEKLENKFLRCLYKKQYGVYPSYPVIHPTLFLLGMTGYHILEVRRHMALATYVFKVFRGWLNNNSILEEIGVKVPNARLRRGPRQEIFVLPKSRTNILIFAPLTVALNILNKVSGDIDLFHCTLTEFTKAILGYLGG